MAGDFLNLVVAKVTIKGIEQKFVYLKLNQMFNGHHRFTIIVNYLSPNNTFQQTPEKFIEYVGETANITFYHKRTGETNEFEGIITQVEMVGCEGEHGGIALHGASPTILLDNNPTLDSWADKTLNDIIKDATKEYTNVPLLCHPQFQGLIPYMSQYKESAFNFLNRMSKEYGEWFYYDGTKVYFGNPQKEKIERIVYDVDLDEVRLIANLVPGKFTKYDYVANENKPYSSDAPDTVDGMDDFQTQALKRSNQAYSPSTTLFANPCAMNKEELETQLEVAKTMATSRMINITGISKTCRISIGNVIDIYFPLSMTLPPLGKFRITQITHEVQRDGHYSNQFIGISAGMKYIPVKDIPSPIAMSELATVTDNRDVKQQGRVKVHFDWQKDGKTTNWIRVQTPDAGSSGDVPKNRGFVFIPEVNDQVLVSYLHGDPDRPFVAGSLYHADSGKGGDTNSKTKSITTRSGCTLTIDDERGSVTLRDKKGSESQMDMDGGGNISITSKSSISLQCGNTSITMNAKEEEVKINAKRIIIKAEESIEEYSKLILMEADNDVKMTAKSSISIKSDDKLSVDSNTTSMNSSSNTTINGATIQLN